VSNGPADADARVKIDRPSSAVSGGAAVKFRDLLRYFLVVGTIGFGGRIAIAGHVQRDLVEERQWMDRQDLLDGIALGLTMLGPPGAPPIYRGVVIPGRWFVRHRDHSRVRATVKGATPAAAGAIAGATIVLGRQAIIDVATVGSPPQACSSCGEPGGGSRSR
jgi:chromate transporter